MVSNFLMFFFIMAQLSVVAQKLDTIEVNTDMSTYILFPDGITFTDCLLAKETMIEGSIGRPISISSNGRLLTVYANVVEEFFTGTNIFVGTASAQYMFILSFNSSPEKLFYRIGISDAVYINETLDFTEEKPQIIPKLVAHNKGPDFNAHCITLMEKEPSSLIAAIQKHQMVFALTGIHIKEDYLYFTFYIENRSNLSYMVNTIDFFVASKGKSKKTVQQKEQLSPAFTYRLPAIIGEKPERFIMVFDKFTMLKNESLNIILTEKNGERDIDINTGHKAILESGKF